MKKQLIESIECYLESMGFKVFSHVQLNLSWGNIISDIDLIAIGESVIIGVEVKSSRDTLKNAKRQIDRMTDLFDGVYVASDKPEFLSIEKFAENRVGLLLVGNNDITIKKNCDILTHRPRKLTLMRLRKDCLKRMAHIVGGSTNGNKTHLVSIIMPQIENEHLRLILKQVIICDRNCDNCPICALERNLIRPLKNIQMLWENSSKDLTCNPPLVLTEYKDETGHTQQKK
jgi:hypothetical protein